MDIEAKSERQLASARSQLSGDITHLRKLHSGLERTLDVICAARRAYEKSLELLQQHSDGSIK
jgi:hypothetical protein